MTEFCNLSNEVTKIVRWGMAQNPIKGVKKAELAICEKAFIDYAYYGKESYISEVLKKYEISLDKNEIIKYLNEIADKFINSITDFLLSKIGYNCKALEIAARHFVKYLFVKDYYLSDYDKAALDVKEKRINDAFGFFIRLTNNDIIRRDLLKAFLDEQEED